jgi:NAD+ kinase
MKTIGIYGQYLHDGAIPVIKKLLEILESHHCNFTVEKNYHALLLEQGLALNLKPFTAVSNDYDAIISIGGDGTILRAVAIIGRNNIPIIGINTGRLGFLAMVQTDRLEQSMQALFEGRYTLSKRSLVTASSNLKENPQVDKNFALNEVSVSRMNTTSMIQVETRLNGELLTSYWADGLIVSTPTGSTGYSLSCGGPVISPQTDAFIITPIAPHNLSARPLVIPDSTIISLKVTGREDEFLVSLDNRISSYPNETVITIKKADFTINLIELHEQTFIKTIRHKLLWGEDKRN